MGHDAHAGAGGIQSLNPTLGRLIRPCSLVCSGHRKVSAAPTISILYSFRMFKTAHFVKFPANLPIASPAITARLALQRFSFERVVLRAGMKNSVPESLVTVPAPLDFKLRKTYKQ